MYVGRLRHDTAYCLQNLSSRAQVTYMACLVCINVPNISVFPNLPEMPLLLGMTRAAVLEKKPMVRPGREC